MFPSWLSPWFGRRNRKQAGARKSSSRTARLGVEQLEDRTVPTTLASVSGGGVYPEPIVQVLSDFNNTWQIYLDDGPLKVTTEVTVAGSNWTAYDNSDPAGQIFHSAVNKNQGIIEFDVDSVSLTQNSRVTLDLADLGGRPTDDPDDDSRLAPPTLNAINICGYTGDGQVTTSDYNGGGVLVAQVLTDPGGFGWTPRYHVDVTDFVRSFLATGDRYLGFRFEAGSAAALESFGFGGTLTIEESVPQPPTAVDDTAATDEDTPLTLTQADLKGNDTDPDNSNDQLTVTAVSNAANGSVVLNADGSVTFTPALNFHGAAGFDYTISDGSLSTNGRMSITVNAVNDAPVLTGGRNFTRISENDTNNGGNPASALVVAYDVDAAAMQGIAVVATVDGNGHWQYALQQPDLSYGDWTAVGTVSGSQALLLRAQDKLRFMPDAQNGTSGFVTYHAWDQTGSTAGAQGTKVDLASGGGTSAFSLLNVNSYITVDEVNDPPSVSFTVASQSVNEAAGTATITAVLSEAIGADVVIPLTLSGTANNPGDYTTSANSLIIRAGQTTGTISISLDNDTRYELVDTIVLTMGTIDNAVLGSETTHTVNIESDDPRPQVVFTSTSQDVDEDTSTVTIKARLNAVSDLAVTVPLIPLGGTASLTDDVTLTMPRQIVIAAGVPAGDPGGEPTGTYTFSVRNDALQEGNETITFQMGTPQNAYFTKLQLHTVTIKPNDAPTVKFTTASREPVNENGTTRQFTVTAELSALSPERIVVPLTFKEGEGYALRGSDYSVDVEQLTFAPYQKRATLTVTILGDTLAEANEYVQIVMDNPTNATLGPTITHGFWILPNDKPSAYFAAPEQGVWEDAPSATVTFSLSNPSTTDVTVEFGVGGTARAGYDYGLTANTIVIKSGETSANFTVPLINDRSNEYTLDGSVTNPWETIQFTILRVTSNNAYVGAKKTHTLKIKDDDPIVLFAPSTGHASESDGTIATYVSLSAPTNKPVTVPLVFSGTAKRGTTSLSDYVVIGPTTQVVIPAGVQTVPIYYRLFDDNRVDPNETIVVRARSAPTNALLDTPASFTTIVIKDDESPPEVLVSFKYSSMTVAERFGAVTVTAELSSPAESNVIVPILVGGTARRGNVDYLFGEDSPASTDIIVIRAGALSGSTTILVKDDTVEESSETVVLTIDGPFGAVAAFTKTFTLTILDDDALIPYVPIAQVGTISLETSFPSGGESFPPPGAVPTTGGSAVAYPAGTLAIYTGFDGYLAGSLGFFDANKNRLWDYLDLDQDGEQDEGELLEPAAVTDIRGAFALEVPAFFDRDGNGNLDTYEGQIVLQDGVDASTGLPLNAPLIAPLGSFAVSPLSTLMASLIDRHGMSLDEAHERVRAAFGLPDVDLTMLDAIAAAAAGDPHAAAVFAANAQLQDTIVQTAQLLAGSAAAPPLAFLMDLVSADIAAKIVEPDAVLDLGNTTIVATIIHGALFGTGLELPPEVIAGAAQIIAAGNQHVAALPIEGGLALVSAVARMQAVAQGNAATQLAAVAAGTVDVSQAVAALTGAALQSAIGAVPARDVVPAILSIADAREVETDNGRMLEFTVTLENPSVSAVAVAYQTLDISALAGSDYEPSQGTLTWLPGDSTSRTIQVQVLGDSGAEPDESFMVWLNRATNAIIRRDVGEGFILNDDALVYQAPAGSEPNDVLLRLDGDRVALFRNHELVLQGKFSLAAPITIRGSAVVATTLTIDLVNGVSPVLAGGLMFEGGALGSDSLILLDAAALEVHHQHAGAGTGSILVDGATLSYRGVASIQSRVAPTIIGAPAASLEGAEIALGSQLADLEPEAIAETTFHWRVRRQADTVAEVAGLGLQNFRFTPSDDGEYVVQLTVGSEDQFASDNIHIIVANVAPTVRADTYTGSQGLAVAGNVITDGTADSDPAAANDPLTVIGYTQPANGTVAMNADGSFTYAPTTTFSGTDSFAYTISDGDGGAATATVTLVVHGPTGASITTVADTWLGGTALLINGTTADDQIMVEPGSTSSTLKVTLNGAIDTVAKPSGRIIVMGGAGNDNIQIAAAIANSVWLYGDSGDDRLNAGNASPDGNLLFGGDDNDELLGGSGRDIMIGGQGADKIIGNADDDILIAGLTTYDSRSTAGHEDFWCRVMDEWTDITVAFLARVDKLRNGTGSTRVNLLANVLDDNTADQIDMLQGGSGNDWFIFNAGEDKMVGQTEASN